MCSLLVLSKSGECRLVLWILSLRIASIDNKHSVSFTSTQPEITASQPASLATAPRQQLPSNQTELKPPGMNYCVRNTEMFEMMMMRNRFSSSPLCLSIYKMGNILVLPSHQNVITNKYMYKIKLTQPKPKAYSDWTNCSMEIHRKKWLVKRRIYQIYDMIVIIVIFIYIAYYHCFTTFL